MSRAGRFSFCFWRKHMTMRVLTLALACVQHTQGAAAAADGVTDWLLGAVPDVADVTQGTLEGVPTLVLSNGLVQRTFAMLPPVPGPPPGPPAPPVHYSKCPANCTVPPCQDGAC